MLQKCARHVVDGSQSTMNDQHLNAQGIALRVAEDQLDLAGMRRNCAWLISNRSEEKESYFGHLKSLSRHTNQRNLDVGSCIRDWKVFCFSRSWTILHKNGSCSGFNWLCCGCHSVHNLKSISESLMGDHENGREVEVLHVIRTISELLVESPKDVVQNSWVPLFFSPDSNGGESYTVLVLHWFDIYYIQHVILTRCYWLTCKHSSTHFLEVKSGIVKKNKNVVDCGGSDYTDHIESTFIWGVWL